MLRRKLRIVRCYRGLSILSLAAVLAVPLTGFAQPTTAPTGMSLSDQVTDLRAKVANLEMALKHKQMGMAPEKPAMGSMPGMGKMGAMGGDKSPMGPMGNMPSSGGSMAGMPPAPPTNGAAPAMGGMMMEMGAMMQQMGGMMDMKMGSTAPAPGGGMSAAGSPTEPMPGMPPAPPMAKMESGMMGMDSMMGMPPAPAMTTSALPGFPGASHLYHIGADDFFLNHDQHIVLTVEQRATLSQVKEAALLEKATAERKVAEAEQELWTLTASDQPEVAKIEGKLREIEKLRGDERLNFIRAVGDSAKVLTDEQRKALLGLIPPQNPSRPPTPAATMAPMKDM